MDEIESQDVVTEEVEEAEAPEADNTTEEPKVEKPKETLEQKEARLARELSQTRKKLGKDEEKPPIEKPNTGELDDTQLDYLDLKGITEQEDIDVIQNVMKRTGQSLREVLKDDYVATKLKANKNEREVANATPSGTKRGASGGVNLEALVAKAERTGEMPADYELRSKVVNALEAKNSPNRPAWHRN